METDAPSYLITEFPVGADLLPMQEMEGSVPELGELLEKEAATGSNSLAWEIQWT